MPKKAIPPKRPRGEQKKADTIKKRQDAQKMKLLELLEESPNIGVALSRIGINRSTYSRWKAEDAVFTVESNKAIERGVEKTADLVEVSLLNSARDGNVQAQKYYLDNNHKRYRAKKYGELQQEDVLTEERKAQIYRAAKAWSYVDPDEDELDSDYEFVHEDEKGNSNDIDELASKKEGPKYDEDGYLIK